MLGNPGRLEHYFRARARDGAGILGIRGVCVNFTGLSVDRDARGEAEFYGCVGGGGLAVVLVTLGRAVAVYSVCALFWRTSLRVSTRHQHALFWGDLRGALALALALGLPDGVADRELILTVSFAAVSFSIFVQGLTMAPLLRGIGEISR